MSHPVDKHVGHKFKQARLLRRLSQADVANEAGVSFQQVQKFESGANRISASRLFEFSQILRVSPDFFFEGLVDKVSSCSEDTNANTLFKAVGAIECDVVKGRIVTFIEDVLGVADRKKT